MTLEQIQAGLQDRRITVVAKITGIHPNTIRAIRNGKAVNPSYQVVKALSDYLNGGGANG